MLFKEISLKGKYLIEAKIELKTGLHIGTAGNSLEIGGVDNSVIKDAFGRPYIPGSSLKGKLRSLTEFHHDKLSLGNVIYSVYNEVKSENNIRMHMCRDENCPVCGLFGRNHGEHKVIIDNDGKIKPEDFSDGIQPTRLIVRDAILDEDSISDEMRDNMDLDYTEVKFENNLDRITSAANPRQTERVPAGARFKCSFVVNVYNDDGNKYLNELITALRLLEDDYLGGQGSRGYGQVKFKDIKICYRDADYYKGNNQDERKYEYKELGEIKKLG
ncbi:type III-A CRISPR-associated RAMP protein Csm3 [Fonticella tunisiensis]|uniref:CRISPR system Cms endoribonuclease Csm3 n=1 Tax=Fonticella tunisiensis TaxID=1096341 RepID=A0A4R7KE16_9CLOT|nr:type III-A CRISPR-associated RAMP protein Csm3 [Fonticella tunisiensis]TDT51293.1 CRISPR-associated Csm3 family protein [Fonticella tunisiensis]